MKNTVEKLTAEKVAESRAKGINFDDIAELTEEDFARGHFKYWKPVKKSITVRINLDNLTWLKEAGKGYQTRLNEGLRWAKMHGCPLA